MFFCIYSSMTTPVPRLSAPPFPVPGCAAQGALRATSGLFIVSCCYSISEPLPLFYQPKCPRKEFRRIRKRPKLKLKNTRYRRLGIVGHTFNPGTERQTDLCGFKDRERYIVRPYLKKNYRVERFFLSETWISYWHQNSFYGLHIWSKTKG